MSYRFDPFEFSRERGLLRDGHPVALEPRALELLELLLENRARVVSKEELVERIWNGRLTSDASISTLVRTLRRTLGDDRTQQRYIRTHPKRGFEFVEPVETVVDATIVDIDKSRVSWRALRPSRIVGAGLAAIAIVTLVAVGGAWLRGGSGANTVEPPRLSLAVLPFENLSGDADLDYLADAFTEDLVTDLSRIRDAFVISRSTTFTYRGKEVDAATVADELGVRYVLEGSLQVTGERVRINAQLIDGQNDSHLWSNRYERDLGELFSVQDNVTGRIASVLRAELRVADDRRQGPVATGDAWDHALRGNVLLYNYKGLSDYQEAYALLMRAVALDPGIASAWSGLAFVHYVASLMNIPGISEPDSGARSLEAARRAAAIDPSNAEPYWLIGVGFAREGEPERGMSACETAIALNPNMDCGHVCAALVSMSMGRPREAVPFLEHALRLNPRFRPFTKQKYLGIAQIESDQPAAAIDALNRALAGAPDDVFANLALASALALDGRTSQARATLTRTLQLGAGNVPTPAGLRDGYGWLGADFERVLDGLQLAGMVD